MFLLIPCRLRPACSQAAPARDCPTICPHRADAINLVYARSAACSSGRLRICRNERKCNGSAPAEEECCCTSYSAPRMAVLRLLAVVRACLYAAPCHDRSCHVERAVYLHTLTRAPFRIRRLGRCYRKRAHARRVCSPPHSCMVDTASHAV